MQPEEVANNCYSGFVTIQFLVLLIG